MDAATRVIVLGSINTDLVVKGRRLPTPGETVLGGEFYQADGGKGANQAVAAARAARKPVTFIAAIGDDAQGQDALQRLKLQNLDCRYIHVVPGVPSGVALILVDECGQNMIGVASGANAELSAADVAAIPDAVFTEARVFLACLESPLQAVSSGLRRARRSGLTTILNPAPASRDLLDVDWLPLVDILTPNAGEAAHLAGLDVPQDIAQAVRAARVLQRKGCRSIVVTLGAAGCVVVADEATPIPAHPVQAVDATAAGDAFNGVLAVALAEGRALIEAAHWANAAAAISTTRRGAQPSLPHRQEIESLLAGAAAQE